MVIVEARLFSGSVIYSCSDRSRSQLVTERMPFPEFTDPGVTIMISKGKRPPKPRHFDAPGITPAVWKIAKRCWHEKAKERPEVNAVLQDLENLANPGPGVCTHETHPYLEWAIIDPRIYQMTDMCRPHSSNGCRTTLTADCYFYWGVGYLPSILIPGI